MSYFLTRNNETAIKFGTHEISLKTDKSFGNPYFDVDFKVIFTRPDGTNVSTDGFYDGGKIFKARAYCDMVGQWKWKTVSSHPDLSDRTGFFEVFPSLLKGKLRIHPDDKHQYVYDNGDWFLHIGDTAYRYVVDTELFYKEYLNQAATAGFTKLRCWFCQDRSNVQALFQYDRKYLNLSYWQEAEKRLFYALNNYPEINIQLIIYGEDIEEVRRYARGDQISKLAARYAQARFSAFANISWCIANDFRLEDGSPEYIERDGQDVIDKEELREGIKQIGYDMLEREPWGTLITNHQSRFSGYMFTDETWSDIITLEDLGQVEGELILKYRKEGNYPVVLEEDRYEHWRIPKHDRYFFRRLMWASLLSGGHATYGGLKTYEQYDGGLSGLYGYFDACQEGKLEEGAHDFIQIHKFFKDTGITLVGMIPDDAIAGGQPLLYKVSRSEDKDLFIIYLANPDIYQDHKPDGFDGNYTDEFAAPAKSKPSVTLAIPDWGFRASWFNPVTGEWLAEEIIDGGNCKVIAPGSGDWVVYLKVI